MVARVIAIDGPAASGKSSVARRLAAALDIPFISTGSMYRAMAWVALNGGRGASVPELVKSVHMEYVPDASGSLELSVNGEFPREALRSDAVSELAATLALEPEIRAFLTSLQRGIAGDRWVVMEGRDIGSVVFPDAAFKLFLTATPEERARRRLAQEGGASLAEVAARIAERDRMDATRPIAPLKVAEGAILFDSSGQTLDETIDKLLSIITVHRTPYRVSYGDTDNMQVVYYANYLEFMERGRTEMLRSVGLTYRELEAMGVFLPVADVHLRYLAPARYDDLLTICSQVLSARGARLVIKGSIYCEDKLLVEGEITLCCVDASRRPCRVPEALVNACAIYGVRGEVRHGVC